MRACNMFAALITNALSNPAEAEDPDPGPTSVSSGGWAQQAEDTESTLIILFSKGLKLLFFA
jgi:hypothetical protein